MTDAATTELAERATDPAADPSVDFQLALVPIERIRCVDENVRVSEGRVDELQASYDRFGHMGTVTLRPIEGTDDFDVIEGHRYYRACCERGLTSIPAFIKFGLDKRTRVVAQLTLNDPTVRLNFEDRDRQRGVQLALDAGLSEAELLAMTTNEPAMRGALAIAKLPPAARRMAQAGKLTVTDALAITEVVEQDPAALKPLLQAVREGEPVAAAARQVAEQRRREAAVATARQKVAEDGDPLIPTPGGHLLDRPNSKLRKLGKGAYDLHLSLERHRGQPCHAASINEYTGKITYYCTDSKRHGGEKGSNIPDPSIRRSERAATIALNKAKAAATLVRRALIATLAKAEQEPPLEEQLADIVTLVIGGMRGADGWQAAEIAGTALGLEPVRRDTWSVTSYDEALRQYAAQGPSQARRVALTFLLAQGELDASRGMYYSRDRLDSYLDVLVRHGYVPATHEAGARAAAAA